MDGRGWIIGGEVFTRNPRLKLPDIFMEVMQLWALCNRSDMANPILPEAGGMLDQPAWLMDAFAVIDRAMRPTRDAT